MPQQDLPQIPAPRQAVLDVSPLYRTLRGSAPVTRVRARTGDVAWLATGYAEAKALLADPRLGRSHPDPESAARTSNAAVNAAPTGDADTEAADHARLRRLLTPAFSARRIRALRTHIAELVSGLLDSLTEQQPPADLHETLSFPLPALVICELLGVPDADRDRFRVWSQGIVSLTDRETAQESMRELVSYIHELINRKRSAPAEDVISDLVAAQPEWGYDDGYIARLGAGLLFAGHETTVARIDFGTLLLTTHPEQRAALARDPELIPRAVDEILRMATPSDDDQLLRYANADIDIAGVRIKAGDAVLIALTAGNRDPEMFPDPDSFDVTRPNNGHLAFGHGAHYCIGASLARVELHEVFGALLQRMPTLRLATPLDQLELRTDVLTGGLVSLPVTW